MSVDDRYPLAVAALRRLRAHVAGGDAAALAAFRLGPAVLRPPPATSSLVRPPAGGVDDARAQSDDTELLGELVDMVLVGADDSTSRVPEVHLQFKADVFGGLLLRLQKQPDGLVANFVVSDAGARRAVAEHVEALLDRLRGRGFPVVRHSIDVTSE